MATTEKERILKANLAEAYDELLIHETPSQEVIDDATTGRNGLQIHISVFTKNLYTHRYKEDKIRIPGNKDINANAFWNEENRRKSRIKKFLIENLPNTSNIVPDFG